MTRIKTTHVKIRGNSGEIQMHGETWVDAANKRFLVEIRGSESECRWCSVLIKLVVMFPMQ